MVRAGAFFLGLPSYVVAGADSARVPPVSHGGFQKNFIFNVACLAALFALGKLDTSLLPPYLSVYFGVDVACGVQRIGFFGNTCATWFNSGYMFFEGFGRICIFFTLR